MNITFLSRIPDYKINALNVLVQLPIKDYLSIASSIIDKNEMQRKRVKSSKSIYSLLRADLRKGCTIPPVFLAVRKEAVGSEKKIADLEKLKDTEIKTYIEKKKLIILDGLQRTYQMIELENELKKEGNKEELNRYLNRPVRAEIYIGINKIGILYRMLTLNTGQTPMSTRHQIEILYQDYLGQNKINGIELVKEIDSSRKLGLGKYKFNEVVDGFQSYLEKDDLGIDRGSILEDVKSLEKLSKVGQKKELFQDFVLCYHHFLEKVIALSDDWELDEDDAQNFGQGQPFGMSAEDIFLRGQVLTGFGAAIGSLEDAELIDDLDEIDTVIKKIKLGGDPEDVFENLLETLEKIRKTSKKIGNSQRRYFNFFFRSLFNSDGESYLNIAKTVNKAFANYSVEFF
jgi:hypothetical protein